MIGKWEFNVRKIFPSFLSHSEIVKHVNSELRGKHSAIICYIWGGISGARMAKLSCHIYSSEKTPKGISSQSQGNQRIGALKSAQLL
ncbi:hypothetical protein J6590_018512 [Homalodisca vitripennis]|nr:hypothetical protein J6590_018512 [Homalodisca vitripennis]